MLQRRQQT